MDRSEAIKELKEMKTDIWTDSRQMEALNMAINALQSYETVTEFADRCRECGKMRTGYWIKQQNKEMKMYGWFFCSECGAYIGEPTNFCSECGADMRGDTE